MATPSKRARRQRATIVFYDESGLLLNPLVRRTLAPKGQTPTLVVRARHRQKVSLIGALTLSSKRRRCNLYFHHLVDGHFHQHSVADFVRQLLRHIRGRIILIGDNWNAHKGAAMRQVVADHPRLELAFLPPYAPQLNPVEGLWSWVKWHRLANLAVDTVQELARFAIPVLAALARQPQSLQGFWYGAKLIRKTTKLNR